VVPAREGANIAAGILTGDAQRVDQLIEQGFSFVAVGSDSSLLRSAACAAAQSTPTS
jgi:2-keto-3-deoxy-L-rhamnonate aldolase RhmA